MPETERLLLRRWEESDAESLYEYAKDPDVGPIAGWPPHGSVGESLDVIRNVFCGKECYAVCLKTDGKAIGAIELKLRGRTDMTDRDDECELGYWLGKPFWGRGIMPEAVKALLRRAFTQLGMEKVWCGYYDGNDKSRRVQEKCGFRYQWTTEGVDVPLMHEKRTGHINCLTRAQWQAQTFSRIETPRLVLRKAKESDLDAIWKNVWRDASLAETMLWTPTETRDAARDRLARTMAYQAESCGYFVCLKDTDEPIGFAGVRETAPGEYSETGICIAREWQRRGFGKEVLAALVDLVFNKLDARRFVYSCFHDNAASVALCRSCGFTFLGSEPQTRERDGYAYLCDTYELTR